MALTGLSVPHLLCSGSGKSSRATRRTLLHEIFLTPILPSQILSENSEDRKESKRPSQSGTPPARASSTRSSKPRCSDNTRRSAPLQGVSASRGFRNFKGFSRFEDIPEAEARTVVLLGPKPAASDNPVKEGA